MISRHFHQIKSLFIQLLNNRVLWSNLINLFPHIIYFLTSAKFKGVLVWPPPILFQLRSTSPYNSGICLAYLLTVILSKFCENTYLLTLLLFAGVSRVRALSPAWTGFHARETLISRTHLFLPHDLPPTKKLKNLDLHFAINISGNSPFGTPELMNNAEWVCGTRLDD